MWPLWVQSEQSVMQRMSNPNASLLRRISSFVLLSVCFVCSVVNSSAAEAKKSFNLPAGDAEQALKAFAVQSGMEVLFVTEATAGVKTPAVKGDLTPREALDQLLSGTPLVASDNGKSGAVRIRREASVEQAEKNVARAAPSGDRPTTVTGKDNQPVELPSFEVMGTKLINMDRARSRDDSVPFIIVDRSQIDQSGASSFYDFMRNTSQNTTTALEGVRTGFTVSFFGNMRGTINLRGLGAGDSLVLINGRRPPAGGTAQPASNSIPSSIIERIEYLPSSASAIYGADASGGVMNIITRSDFHGNEITLSYGNTTSKDAKRLGVSLLSGMRFGNTRIVIGLDAQTDNNLVSADRGYYEIERRKILAQDPTIIYGVKGSTANPSNPYGDTPNVYMPTNGQNLPILGVPYASVPVGTTGQITATVFNPDFNLSQRSSINRLGGATELMPETERRTAIAIISHRFNNRWEAFLEGSYSYLASYSYRGKRGLTSTILTVPASSPFNPFGVTVRVTNDKGDLDLLGYDVVNENAVLSIGLIGKVSPDWTLSVFGGYGRDYSFTTNVFYNSTLLNQFVAGTAPGFAGIFYNPFLDFNAGASNSRTIIDQVRQKRTFKFNADSSQASIRLNGSLWHLTAGPTTLTAGGDYHVRRVLNSWTSKSENILAGSIGAPSLFPIGDDSVTDVGAYLEATVPLVSANNSKPGIRDLTFEGSARVDRFDQFGTTRNPQIGIRYQPFAGLILRGFAGSGFRTPSFTQSAPPTVSATSLTITDPKRGQTYSVGQQIQSGDPSLRPESSESYGFGVIYEPRGMANLRISADWFSVRKDDVIAFANQQAIVDNEQNYPGRVTRTTPEPNAPNGVGLITSIYYGYVNATFLETKGIDLNVDYGFRCPLGDLNL